MINKIHILGASGSGTTTLAKTLSKELDYKHFDTDDYFWEPTNPPYQQKCEVAKRKRLLRDSLEGSEKWVLSGSLCGWGDIFIPYFDLVIYLWLPQDIRIDRLVIRERERYGDAIEEGGIMHQDNQKFIDWASQYDTGDMSIRSRMLHEKWLSELKCKVLRIEGNIELTDKLQRIFKIL